MRPHLPSIWPAPDVAHHSIHMSCLRCVGGVDHHLCRATHRHSPLGREREREKRLAYLSRGAKAEATRLLAHSSSHPRPASQPEEAALALPLLYECVSCVTPTPSPRQTTRTVALRTGIVLTSIEALRDARMSSCTADISPNHPRIPNAPRVCHDGGGPLGSAIIHSHHVTPSLRSRSDQGITCLQSRPREHIDAPPANPACCRPRRLDSALPWQSDHRKTLHRARFAPPPPPGPQTNRRPHPLYRPAISHPHPLSIDRSNHLSLVSLQRHSLNSSLHLEQATSLTSA